MDNYPSSIYTFYKRHIPDTVCEHCYLHFLFSFYCLKSGAKRLQFGALFLILTTLGLSRA